MMNTRYLVFLTYDDEYDLAFGNGVAQLDGDYHQRPEHHPLNRQRMEDLDRLTTFVLNEYPEGDRPDWVEGAQRLRDAAGLDDE